jgi:hypothetical protein
MSDSKAIKTLKAIYKSEKEAGLTAIKSFKDWHAAYQLSHIEADAADAPDTIVDPAPVFAVPANIDQIKLPTVDEALLIAEQALQIAEVAEVKIAKSVLAAQIFEAALKTGPLVRANVIKQFMTKIVDGGAELSKAGANTYYHNLKAKHGLVVSKTA